MSPRHRFHLIANAHLDPVWLWDWREGLNEIVNSTRTLLVLMDEFPELTVVRGETLFYTFLEREVPDVFARVVELVNAGRWEPVGGTFVQADHNLPSTETLRRQFETGQSYFRSRFGRQTSVAWAPDAFGHSAGLPEVFAASGISYFAHCRPFASTFPLDQPAYWWLGQGGARILSYRSPIDWYCNERNSLPERLDQYRRASEHFQLSSTAVYIGLGNHGGGPTRRMLHELRSWMRDNPDIELVHSGLNAFFKDVEQELVTRPELKLPEYRGELGYCLRGCYASVAKFKFPYRKTEHALLRAGKIAMMASLHSERLLDTSPLDAAWKTILFNSFHDILPGSSIERAYQDQLAQIGGAADLAQRIEFAALNRLARTLDTSVPSADDDEPTLVPFLVCNPHSFQVARTIEFEVQLDWRPLVGVKPTDVLPLEVLDADGRALPFQVIACENRAMTNLVWRARLVVPLTLAASGCKILRAGFRRNARIPQRATDLRAINAFTIANEAWTLSAPVHGCALTVLLRGRNLFPSGGIEIALVDDQAGSWGEMTEASTSPAPMVLREKWVIAATQILESGPELLRLWVRFTGARSRIDLTLSLHANSNEIHISGRLFLDERSARVKLVFPGVEVADFEVPGGTCVRGQIGEVAGIGFVRAMGKGGGFVLATDALSSFRIEAGALHATVARATRYADDVPTPADEHLHLPSVDIGELRFQAIVAPPEAVAEKLSLVLQQPIVVQSVPPARSSDARQFSGMKLSAPVQILAAEPTLEGVRIIVQNNSDRQSTPDLEWNGRPILVPDLAPWQIAVWHFARLPFQALRYISP